MRINNKYRGFYYAVLLCLALPYFAYSFSIADMIESKSLFNKQKSEIERLEQIIAQGKQSTQFDDSKVPRNELLIEILQPTLDKVTVESFTPLTEIKRGELGLQTLSLVLSGDFISLVKVLDYIENQLSFCKLCSVSFDVVKDLVASTEKLVVSIIIQQITS